GATSCVLSIPSAQACDAGHYYVGVSNAYGSTWSVVRSGILFVLGPPAFGIQPDSITVPAGQAAEFSAWACGGGFAVHYQWQFNGADIPGETAESFTISSAQAADAGQYAVVATNGYGSV